MVLQARKAGSSTGSAEVLSFNVEEVGFDLHPCPDTFHAKVASWKDETGSFVRLKELKLEDIQKKQERAKQYRLESQKAVASPQGKLQKAHAVEERAIKLQRLQEKQKYAQDNRGRVLSRKTRPARTVANRLDAARHRRAAEQQSKKQRLERNLKRAADRRAAVLEDSRERARSLSAVRPNAQESAELNTVKESEAERVAEKLATASRAREDHLATLARSAADRVARAKAVAATERAAAAELAASRLRAAQARLAAAAARREAALRERAAAHARRAPDAFLRANACRIERLRHSVALRRIQSAWRAFASSRSSTTALTRAFVHTSVPGAFQPTLDHPAPETPTPADPSTATHTIGQFGTGSGMRWQRDFDQFAAIMQAPATLAAARALLRRLEATLSVLHSGSNPDAAGLLRRLFPKTAAAGGHIDRYPPRIFLCAYMLLSHPETLLNGASEWEGRLLDTSKSMLRAFEALAASYVPDAAAPSGSVREQLKEFDEAWVDFLEIFVTWKGEDAASIEAELVRMAVDMQSSMLAAAGVTDAADAPAAAADNPQLEAIVAQVEHDKALLRSRVGRLSGPAAVKRFDAAVAAATPSARPRSASSRSSSSIATPRRRAGSASPQSSPSNSPAASLAVPADPAVDPAAAGPAVPPPDGNEQLLAQLLLDPAFRLPLGAAAERWEAVMDATGERTLAPPLDVRAAGAGALRAHVVAAAQDALADAALSQLAAAPADAPPAVLAAARQAAFAQVADVLAELAAEAFEAIPAAHAEAAGRDRFERAALHAAFEGAASLQACVGVVAGLLDNTVQLVLQLGAPGREAKARAAIGRITTLLHGALASAPADSPAQYVAVAGVLSRALRLLLAQMRVLNADAANGRLRMLAAMLAPADAARTARDKLAARAGIAASAQEADIGDKLPISARFGASSPSAQHVSGKVTALREAYGPNATSALPATIQTGRGAATSQAAPPPGSLLAAPLLLTSSSVDTWQARFRSAVAALMLNAADLAGNPEAPEILQPFGGTLDHAKGLFQKAVVIAVCMRVAADAAIATQHLPLTAAAAASLFTRLTAVEAAGSEGLVATAATVIADALAPVGTTATAAAALEADVLQRLQAAVAAGSSPLQATLIEALHVVQALLVFGRCDGFESLPGKYAAKAAPPKWAHALLADPATAAVHGLFGEVAHDLGRVCAVAESAYGEFVQQLF
eukprot:jgi/Ulvmu1/826/UM010_0200.1